MTDTKQPEALRLANSLQAVRRYKAAAELRRQHAEIEALRAKLNELDKQEHAAFVNEQGFIVGRDDMQISSGEKLYLAAGARPVEPAPAAVVGPSDLQLLKFYRVTTDAELIAAQAAHIEKLQAKLQQPPSFAPQRVREG